MTNGESRTRRDFLRPGKFSGLDSGLSLNEFGQPSAGGTIRLATRAMACDFSVVMNPGSHPHVQPAGDVLEMVHDIESWLSVYKPGSEISFVNRQAAQEPVHIRRPFFELLQTACDLYQQTQAAFDITAGAQIQLWRHVRSEQRLPTETEVAAALATTGTAHLELDDQATTVRFGVPGLLLDPGAIGKGYALDEAARWLTQVDGGPPAFLLHGGHSSLVARGNHNDLPGWPVGVGNPLFTRKRLGTLLLQDQAMSTSGSNIQFFRHQGQPYGHILDPRTGWPVEGMLSVTVLADSAAVADALSTAFFVMGVENAVKCCQNLHNVGAILFPFPDGGKRVRPTVVGIPPEQIYWDFEQVELPD